MQLIMVLLVIIHFIFIELRITGIIGKLSGRIKRSIGS